MKSSKLKRKYKSIIFDVDGTLINGRYAYPTDKVTQAVKKAKKIISVGVATSRPFFILDKVLPHLELNGPSIVLGGATIVESSSGKVLWEKLIKKEDIYKIRDIAKKYNAKVFYTAHDNDYVDFKNKKIVQIWVPALEPEISAKFVEHLTKIPTISHYTVPAWEQGKISIIIGHAEATKQHGIMEIAKILNISAEDIIGVGDGYNDFPLLMACGLKIAMGNAIPDLKEIADYIAPSVDEDGVADVIERFVL